MIELISIGLLLGLSAGFAPGPLLTLVISETLQHDIRAGIKVAISPLLTDIPIIFLCLFVLSRFQDTSLFLGLLSIAGSLFVFYMGWESMHPDNSESEKPSAMPRSFIKGVVTNLLSPHPYLFWFSVGGPTITGAMSTHPLAPAGFMLPFYICLIGAKIGLAMIVGKSARFLGGNIYLYIMRFLGVMLWGFAIFMMVEGVKMLS